MTYVARKASSYTYSLLRDAPTPARDSASSRADDPTLGADIVTEVEPAYAVRLPNYSMVQPGERSDSHRERRRRRAHAYDSPEHERAAFLIRRSYRRLYRRRRVSVSSLLERLSGGLLEAARAGVQASLACALSTRFQRW